MKRGSIYLVAIFASECSMCSQQYPTLVCQKKWSNNRNSAYYRRDKLKTQILKLTASCCYSVVYNRRHWPKAQPKKESNCISPESSIVFPDLITFTLDYYMLFFLISSTIFRSASVLLIFWLISACCLGVAGWCYCRESRLCIKQLLEQKNGRKKTIIFSRSIFPTLGIDNISLNRGWGVA